MFSKLIGLLISCLWIYSFWVSWPLLLVAVAGVSARLLLEPRLLSAGASALVGCVLRRCAAEVGAFFFPGGGVQPFSAGRFVTIVLGSVALWGVRLRQIPVFPLVDVSHALIIFGVALKECDRLLDKKNGGGPPHHTPRCKPFGIFSKAVTIFL